MKPAKPTRQEREKQLRAMLGTQAGKDELDRLFYACFPPGVMPTIGTSVVQTILAKEYPQPPLAP
jgi:hypothetical protein